MIPVEAACNNRQHRRRQLIIVPITLRSLARQTRSCRPSSEGRWGAAGKHARRSRLAGSRSLVICCSFWGRMDDVCVRPEHHMQRDAASEGQANVRSRVGEEKKPYAECSAAQCIGRRPWRVLASALARIEPHRPTGPSGGRRAAGHCHRGPHHLVRLTSTGRDKSSEVPLLGRERGMAG